MKWLRIGLRTGVILNTCGLLLNCGVGVVTHNVDLILLGSLNGIFATVCLGLLRSLCDERV